MSCIAISHGEIAGISGGDFRTEGWNNDNFQAGPGVHANANPRRDFRGNGGNYYIASDSITSSITSSLNFSRVSKEFFFRFAVLRHEGTVTPSNTQFQFRNVSAGNYTGNFQITSEGNLNLITNNGATNYDALLEIPRSTTTWHIFEVHFKASTTGTTEDGFFIVYKDFDYESPVMVEEDFLLRFSSGNSAREIGFIRCTLMNREGLDDIKVNTISLICENSTGPMSPEGNLTLKDSSGNILGTATIDSVEDLGGGKSRLHLYDVFLPDTTRYLGIPGETPFAGLATIETLTNSATCPEGDLEKDSGLPGNTYFAPARIPETLVTADSTPLSVEGAITNIDAVSDGLGVSSETSFVYSDNSGDNDLYDFSAISIPGPDIEKIHSVQVYFKAGKDGIGVDTAVLQSKNSGSIQDIESVFVTEDYSSVRVQMSYDPDTGQDWEYSDLESTSFGIKVE